MKKIKKLTCILLAVSLLIPQLPVKHVNAETAAEVVYAYERFNPKVEGEDVYVLEKNATANSEQWPVAWTNDGPAEWAFDGNDSHWYHSRYQDWDQKGIHDSNDVVTQEIKNAMYTDGNTLWIGSGFDESILLGKVTYQSRDAAQGVIGDYVLYVANLENPTDTPTSDQYEQVKSGSFVRTANAQEIVLSTPVQATHFKLESTSFGGDTYYDSKVITAKNIAVYEAVEVLNQKAVLYVEAEEKWNDIKNNMNNSDATYKAQYDVTMVEENFKAVEAKIDDDSVSDEEYAELLKNVFVFSDATGIGRYLSDVEWVASENGYGTLRLDKTIDNNTITLFDGNSNVTFTKGVGTHATSSITVDVTDYKLFRSYIGLDMEQSGSFNKENHANVIYSAYRDGERYGETINMLGLIQGNFMAMQELVVPLDKISSLQVKADGNGEIHADHADFADAKLYTALAVVPEISVELPTAGKAPTKLANTDKYTVETVWTADGEEVTEFESGKAYNMTATFTAQDGYCFTDAAMADYTMTVVSEGNEKNVTPTVSIAADRKTMTVTYNSMKEVQVAYYTFDNVEGTTVYDEWGANRNGTAAEGVTYVDGKYGKAAKLSETNNITFATDAALNVSMCDNWTVGLWVKIDSLPSKLSAVMEGEGYINSNLEEGTYKRSLDVSTDASNKYGFRTGGGDTNRFGVDPMTAGKWVHLTWVKENTSTNGSVKVYINGVLSQNGTKTLQNHTDSFCAPIDVIGGTGFDGYVDEVKIYSVALTDEQVKASMLTPPEFKGGSLRMTQDATVSTNLRFGYDITDFNYCGDSNEVTEVQWEWKWGLSASNMNRTVTGVKYIDDDGIVTSNLVITNIPAAHYGTDVYAQLTVTYVLSDGRELVFESNVDSRSVFEVADAIKTKYEAERDNRTLNDEDFAQLEKDYAYAIGIINLMPVQ